MHQCDDQFPTESKLHRILLKPTPKGLTSALSVSQPSSKRVPSLHICGRTPERNSSVTDAFSLTAQHIISRNMHLQLLS